MEVTIQLESSEKQLELFGPGDSYLRLLRQSLSVKITARQKTLTISGKEKDVNNAVEVFKKMQNQLRRHNSLSLEDVSSFVRNRSTDFDAENSEVISVYSHRKIVEPTTKGQAKYIHTMLSNDLTFCIGPAGTGKTYLAVAIAR